ncbi:MAG TPA: hypothetical protein VFB82_14325 [Blastocatellia bacterium]|nr:hypothetical protein [Blastocatellia bacterium]
MRRTLLVISVFLLAQSIGFAQSTDKLEGRWAGTVESIQGKQNAAATFKKDGAGYTGTITGLRPGMEAALKDIKVDGDKVTAKTEIETPNGSVAITYNFVVQGDTMKGKGEAEFGGQTFGFDFDMKRGGEAPAAGAQPAQPAPPPRREVPQPQQKQSASYFAGQWAFKFVGRESPLGPAPREGIATFTVRPDGKTIDLKVEGTADGKPFKETGVIVWDEATKMMTASERLANGVQVQSKGDWRSPISIRFTVEPIKVKGGTVQLKRIISVVAAHSFTVTDELSEDGGPFVRLGSAIYSKVGADK